MPPIVFKQWLDARRYQLDVVERDLMKTGRVPPSLRGCEMAWDEIAGRFIASLGEKDGEEIAYHQTRIDEIIAQLRTEMNSVGYNAAGGYPELPGGPHKVPEGLLHELCPSPVGTTLLEVGTGGGICGEAQWRGRGIVHFTCIDIWPGWVPINPSIVVCAAQDALARFGPDSFDVVQCCEMIEHCEKSLGFKILEDFKKIARHFVVLTCPCGYTVQDPALAPNEPWAANPYQKHVSGWMPEDFLEAGYQVYFNGEHPETRSHAGAQLVAYWVR